MKTGLIMEGGAMRGMFTCGVIDVFMEQGVAFDGAAGISAGACFGCNFKSRQIGRPIRYNKRYSRDPRYCSLRSLLKTGDLYGADFCYRELPDVLDPFDRKAFAENPMAFYVGAADVDTGEIVYHECRDGGERDMLWMRASASMPMVSRIVEVDGHRLLDGGIVDPVPYGFMDASGYDRNVYILTQPKGYRKGKTKALPLARLLLHRTPKVAAAMEVRHEVYNRQMDEIDARERRGEILVLRPPEALGIPRTEHDPEQLERVYQLGRREAEKALPAIRAFLAAP
ncbi:MAG: patatin family protein [Oscillospiraceae bacterium]|nr:patatin family protein [Oscillospiraceae bacterium]